MCSMKKIILSLLVMMMAPVAAEAKLDVNNIDIDYANVLIEVEGETTNYDEAVGLYITDGNHVAAFEQASPQNGKIAFSVNIDSNFVDKLLQLEVSQLGEPTVHKEFRLIGIDSINAWLNAVNTLEAGWKDKTNQYYEDVLKMLIADADYYEHNSDDILNLLVNFKQKYSDSAQYAEDINRAIAIKKINECNISELESNINNEQTKKLLKINFEVLDSAYALFNTYRENKSTSEVLDSEGKGFTSPDELLTALKEANFISLINSAEVEAVNDILKEYSKLCSKVNSNFSNISANCTNVAARAVINKNYSTVSQILNDLSYAISQQKQVNDKINSSSSYGAGSGKGVTTIQNGVAGSGNPTAVVSAEQNPDEKYFDDLEGYQWAEEAILQLAKAGIINGFDDNKFMPEKVILREEFVKMAVALMDVYIPHAECDFSDVNKFDWFYPYVASAYMNNIIAGISDTEFGSHNPISRQDMVTVLDRAIKGKRINIPEKELSFTDLDAVDEYAYDSVKNMFSLGVINGFDDGSFAPKKNTTRAEGAVMIYNIYKLLER